MRRHLSTRGRIVAAFFAWGAATVAWATWSHAALVAIAAGLVLAWAALHSRTVRYYAGRVAFVVAGLAALVLLLESFHVAGLAIAIVAGLVVLRIAVHVLRDMIESRGGWPRSAE